MLEGKRVLVTGGFGFLGKYITTKLWNAGARAICFRSKEFNLLDAGAARLIMERAEPDIVIHAAAKVGGIMYNRDNPGKLFHDNTLMGLNTMEAARQYGVEKFVQIGTVCEYPKFATVPFSEGCLWNGYPEETNAPYGVAKKALLTMGLAYRQQYGMNVIHLLPVNMYGPGDNFAYHSSHVIPGLIGRMIHAKNINAPSVEIGASGTVSREFIYVDDAADAIVKATELYNGAEPVNIGSGTEITIKKLADMIALLVQYEGAITLGDNIPVGQPRRCLNTARAKSLFGFEASTPLVRGLNKTIEWYKGQL